MHQFLRIYSSGISDGIGIERNCTGLRQCPAFQIGAGIKCDGGLGHDDSRDGRISAKGGTASHHPKNVGGRRGPFQDDRARSRKGAPDSENKARVSDAIAIQGDSTGYS